MRKQRLTIRSRKTWWTCHSPLWLLFTISQNRLHGQDSLSLWGAGPSASPITPRFTPLFNGWRKTVTADGEIGSEPDHNIGLKVRLLFKHECSVSGILEHLYFGAFVW